MKTNFRPAVLALGALLGCAAALPAQAVNVPGYDGAYLFGGGLYEFEESKRDSDNGAGIWLGGGYPLAGRPGEALELSLRGLKRDRDAGGSDQQETLLAHWVKNVGEGFLENKAQPYVLLGGGLVREDVLNDDHYHFGLDLGAGLLYALPIERLAIRFEGGVLGQVNDKSIPHEDFTYDFQLRLGLQYALGDSGTPTAIAPEKPAAVRTEQAIECPVRVTDPVTGKVECGTDSDGDRVFDSNDQCPGTPRGTEVDSKGCPLAAPGDADGDGVLDAADACPETSVGMKVDATGCVIEQKATLKGVRFETGSAKLTPLAKKILDDVARTLKNQKNLRAEVGGHTDAVGNDAYNLILSQQRAESVRQHLIGRGIGPERLTAQGYGETQPVASNDTPDGREANRRVEFKVTLAQ